MGRFPGELVCPSRWGWWWVAGGKGGLGSWHCLLSVVLSLRMTFRFNPQLWPGLKTAWSLKGLSVTLLEHPELWESGTPLLGTLTSFVMSQTRTSGPKERQSVVSVHGDFLKFSCQVFRIMCWADLAFETHFCLFQEGIKGPKGVVDMMVGEDFFHIFRICFTSSDMQSIVILYSLSDYSSI